MTFSCDSQFKQQQDTTGHNKIYSCIRWCKWILETLVISKRRATIVECFYMCNVRYHRKQDHQYGYVLEMLLYSDIFFYYFLNVSEGGQMYATLKLHTSIGSHLTQSVNIIVSTSVQKMPSFGYIYLSGFLITTSLFIQLPPEAKYVDKNAS